jgi:hypothetical protein
MYLYQRKKLKAKTKRKIFLCRGPGGALGKERCAERGPSAQAHVCRRPGRALGKGRSTGFSTQSTGGQAGQAFDEGSLFADGPLDLAVGTVCDSQM